MDSKQVKAHPPQIVGGCPTKQCGGQVALEFTTAFICLILFLVAAAQIFTWFGNNIVRRQRAYEDSRAKAGNGTTTNDNDVQNFYNQSEYQLKIFN